MCAECHSTNLQKNYRAEQDRFATTWSDLDVVCEACHGPGSQHVHGQPTRKAGSAGTDRMRGLSVALGDPRRAAGRSCPASPIAHRTAPRASDVEVETCAPCHARRAQIWSDVRPGEPLAQNYVLSLLAC